MAVAFLMDKDDYSKKRLIGYTAFAGALVLGGAYGFAAISLPGFLQLLKGSSVVLWDKWSPLFLFFLPCFVILTIRGIAVSSRTYDPERPRHHLRPAFSGDEWIIVGSAFLGIVSPFIVQPIMDWIVFPALGYEYCAALSERSITFGFPTYAYVSDPALCVASPE